MSTTAPATTIDRASLLAFLAKDNDPAQVEQLVSHALAALGWADKNSFSRDDSLQVSLEIAQIMKAALVSAEDPRARQLGQGLELMLGAIEPATP